MGRVGQVSGAASVADAADGGDVVVADADPHLRRATLADAAKTVRRFRRRLRSEVFDGGGPRPARTG